MFGCLHFIIMLFMLFYRIKTTQEERITPALVAKYLNIIAEDNYMTIGCIGFLFDSDMSEKDREFLFKIRMNLIKTRVSAMMITNNAMNRLETRLCLRQHTLMIGLFTYQPLIDHLKKFTTSPPVWNYRKWMIIMDSPPENVDEITWINTNIEIDIEYDSGVFVLLGNQNFIRIFRAQKNGQLYGQKLAIYNKRSKELNFNLSDTRIDLNGLKLRIGVQNSSLSEIKSIKGELKLVSGVYSTIWSMIEKEFNFTTKVISTKKHGWFKNKINGKWNEIESLLLDGTIDAAVSGLVFSPTKSRDFFITPPIYRRRYYIYVEDPNKNSMIPWDTFTAPFSRNLWFVVSGTIIGISITLYMMAKFFGKRIWDKEELRNYTLFNCVFSIYRAFCNQGQEVDPKPLSSRIVFITTYLTAMLVLTSYSGVLISFLTTGRAPLPFDSLEQILQSGTYQVGARINTSSLNFFMMDDGIARDIFNKLINHNPMNLAISDEKGLQRVCTTNFAYVISMEKQVDLELYPCKIIKLQKKYIYNELAIAFNKTFRFQDLLSNFFQELIVHGIISKMIAETDSLFILDTSVLESPTVDITQVTPLLTELAVALLLSGIFLFAEKLYRRSNSHSMHTKITYRTPQYYLKSERDLKPWTNMGITF